LLTNAAKYAQATRVVVTLSVGDGLSLEVLDNGVGLDPDLAQGSGLGLANLANRAEKLGGTLEFAAGENGGAKITWRVPL